MQITKYFLGTFIEDTLSSIFLKYIGVDKVLKMAEV